MKDYVKLAQELKQRRLEEQLKAQQKILEEKYDDSLENVREKLKEGLKQFEIFGNTVEGSNNRLELVRYVDVNAAHAERVPVLSIKWERKDKTTTVILAHSGIKKMFSTQKNPENVVGRCLEAVAEYFSWKV